MKEYSKKELIGQKLLISFDGKEINQEIVDLIKEYKVGGFILYRRNYDTYYELISIIKKLKELNRVNSIPLFICVDQENGRVNRFPIEFHKIKNALETSICDKEVIKEVGDITSEILYKSGINVNFAPTLDIYDEDISSSIGNRCFGKTSKEVINNAGIIINSHINNKVIPIIKHYPGLRKVRIDTHVFLPKIDTIDKEDIKPFNIFMDEGIPGILLSHLIVKDKDKLPISLSKKVQKEIRDKYNGITVTDDLKMRSVRYRYGRMKCAKLALDSGNDIIMFNYPHDKELKVINYYYKMFDKYKDEIEDSALRIIKLKEKYKINDNDFKELSVDDINKYNERIDKVNNIIINENTK